MPDDRMDGVEHVWTKDLPFSDASAFFCFFVFVKLLQVRSSAASSTD